MARRTGSADGRRDLPAYSEALREARLSLDMTGEEVASALRVSPPTYRNAENGRGGPSVFLHLEDVFSEEVASEIRQLWQDARDGAGDHERFAQHELLLPLPLIEGLAEARITRFYPARRYYASLRGGSGTISEYISTATQSVEMVSIALATGMELEGIVSTFEQMLSRPNPCRITVSLLDPEKPYLAQAIAPVVQSSPDVLRGRVQDALDALLSLRAKRVATARQELLQIWCHSCVPNASAILLDADIPSGLVQLETKGYKTGMDASFGFEVGYPSDFYVTLRDSYRDLIADGRRLA